MAAESKTKYDRQLRIWGEQGQTALEKASICLLNCGPTGSEALKNLVLGGVGGITVIDGTKVEKHDLGNNFMLDEASLGQSKARCVCAFLQELNDSVKAKFVEEHPEALIEGNPSFFSSFTLVIATQLLETSLLKLDKICRQFNVMMLAARSYGLTGLVRICLKEHDVVESKPEHFVDDLRLHNPWPELKEFAKNMDLNVTDPVVHKHIPYIVILINIAEKWADGHIGCLPTTRQEKKEFKDLIKAYMLNMDEENYKEAIDSSYKVTLPHGISSQLRQIINDSAVEVNSASPDFWILVAALKEFIENEGAGEPPLEGSIPDMTSLTEYYISLQRIYQAKSESDCLAMEHHVRAILKRIGRDPDSISKAFIKNFCKNARKLTLSEEFAIKRICCHKWGQTKRKCEGCYLLAKFFKVCRYRPLEDELSSPAILELQKYMTDEDYSFSVSFYILLRAVDRFTANYNRFPGLFDNDMDEDISRLKTIAVGVLSDSGLHGSTLAEDLINEICRFGGAEIHPVAAFIGGVASQEAIKLITKQFVPLNGTLVFNGIDQKSQVLAV